MNKKQLIKNAIEEIHSSIGNMDWNSDELGAENLDFYEKEALKIISQIALIKVLRKQP